MIPPSHFISSLKAICDIGFKYLLTSGGEPRAGEGGWEVLRSLAETGRERGLEVIVGGGIRRGNVEGAVRETGTGWVHSSAVLGEGEMVSVEEVRALQDVLEGLEGEVGQGEGGREGFIRM